jgi:hypothetical protein
MVSTSRVLPRPFIEPKSFFEVGIGNEQIQFKPEWAGLYLPAPSDRPEQRKAA